MSDIPALQNKTLQQADQALRAKSKNPQALDRVVQAGLGTMFSEGGSKLFKEQIDKPGDIVDHAAEGAAKLVGVLYEKSKRSMPMDALVQGCMVLLFHGLDFLEQAGKVQVTPEVLAAATKAAGSYVLQLLGVTPQKLQQMTAKATAGKGGPTPPPKPAGIVSSQMGGA